MEILTTEDNVTLAANFVDSGTEAGVILLHQFKSNKESYELLQDSLNDAGFSSLAIDFRGHGKSQEDYKDFSEEDFNKMILDAKAGYEFLKSKKLKKIFIVGASIGSNTAINFAREQDKIKACVALSPSLNYRGIITTQKKPKGKVLIVVSEGDILSFDGSKMLSDKFECKLIELAGSDHGTNMLNSDLIQDIILFLKDNL
jgi:alpha-beta hydrolase superfamily lysophospholipase